MKKTFPYRYRVLIMLFFLMLITYLDRTCISLVGVRIKSEFNFNNEQFGWVLASFSLAYALFEIPSGILGDRIGPKAVFIRIVLFWSLFTALTGVVTGLVSLLVVRFLFGMGESGTYPNSLIVVSRWFPANETSRIWSGVSVGGSVGAALAPLIIIPLASVYGWRVPFFVNGVIGLVWVLVCFLWFRNFPAEMKHISEKEKNHIEANRHYNKEQKYINWKFILKNRTVMALMAMWFFNQCGIKTFNAWMPVYLQEGRRFTENESKPILFWLSIAFTIGLFLGGFISDWLVKKKGLLFGRRFVAMFGMCISSVLIFCTGLPISNGAATFCLITANGFFGFGNIVAFAACADIGRNNAGTVTGAMNFCGQMGAFFFAIIFGKIADVTHSFSAPIFLVAFMMLSACLLWLRIDPTKKISATEVMIN